MSDKFQTLNHTPFTPFSESVGLYAPGFIGITPYEFTGWRDETISWKKTCYLHAGLNPLNTYKLKGPDVIEFLSKVCVTNVSNFPVGGIKHGVMCNEQGKIMVDGVMIRTGEDEVITYCMMPILPFALCSGKYGKYNIEGTELTGQVFLFQVAGPVSIDVLEAVCGQSLRELKFLRTIVATIAGKPVRICRVGMAGTLAYEVHGASQDAHSVYHAIYETGLPFGLRRLGSRCYPMNHSENGFPQWGFHFLTPTLEDEDLVNYLEKDPQGENWIQMYRGVSLRGSAADDINHFYHSPHELGWDKMIKFDHDFVGRSALERIAAENRSKVVSLEWDLEDIADVYISQFRDEQPYKYIEEPNEPNAFEKPVNPETESSIFLSEDASFGTARTGIVTTKDKVINANGEMIGTSFGRQSSAYFHRMISICSLDTAYTELGTEVMVLWGEPGNRQKKIRAKVARYPYNNVLRNESTDVTALPKAQPQK
ncbi:MAG: hypothetical protein LBQ88_04685 [Treponema sp.]|jgi:glycine cleavage system aminomethyltransferase T|nr:hypothetical protein [Treponema sp.]